MTLSAHAPCRRSADRRRVAPEPEDRRIPNPRPLHEGANGWAGTDSALAEASGRIETLGRKTAAETGPPCRAQLIPGYDMRVKRGLQSRRKTRAGQIPEGPSIVLLSVSRHASEQRSRSLLVARSFLAPSFPHNRAHFRTTGSSPNPVFAFAPYATMDHDSQRQCDAPNGIKGVTSKNLNPRPSCTRIIE
jgi:hypothetical protein